MLVEQPEPDPLAKGRQLCTAHHCKLQEDIAQHVDTEELRTKVTRAQGSCLSTLLDHAETWYSTDAGHWLHTGMSELLGSKDIEQNIMDSSSV